MGSIELANRYLWGQRLILGSESANQRGCWRRMRVQFEQLDRMSRHHLSYRLQNYHHPTPRDSYRVLLRRILAVPLQNYLQLEWRCDSEYQSNSELQECQLQSQTLRNVMNKYHRLHHLHHLHRHCRLHRLHHPLHR